VRISTQQRCSIQADHSAFLNILERHNDYMCITPNNEFKNRPVLPLPSRV
jgi:hypothetical protein